jgi:hypothetical protein
LINLALDKGHKAETGLVAKERVSEVICHVFIGSWDWWKQREKPQSSATTTGDLQKFHFFD